MAEYSCIFYVFIVWILIIVTVIHDLSKSEKVSVCYDIKFTYSLNVKGYCTLPIALLIIIKN